MTASLPLGQLVLARSSTQGENHDLRGGDMDRETNNRRQGMGIGLSIGLSIGIAIGVTWSIAFESWFLGMSLGVALGVALGVLYTKKRQ